MPAVRDGHIYEIKSAYILQPGPAALTEGIRQIHHIIANVAQGHRRQRAQAPRKRSAVTGGMTPTRLRPLEQHLDRPSPLPAKID